MTGPADGPEIGELSRAMRGIIDAYRMADGVKAEELYRNDRARALPSASTSAT